MEPEDYEAMMKRMGSESTRATRPAPGPAEGEAVEFAMECAREAHMLGRIYNKQGEQEKPAEVERKLREFCERTFAARAQGAAVSKDEAEMTGDDADFYDRLVGHIKPREDEIARLESALAAAEAERNAAEAGTASIRDDYVRVVATWDRAMEREREHEERCRKLASEAIDDDERLALLGAADEYANARKRLEVYAASGGDHVWPPRSTLMSQLDEARARASRVGARLLKADLELADLTAEVRSKTEAAETFHREWELATAEAAALREQLDDYRDDLRATAEEVCAETDDRKHCSCVPYYRKLLMDRTSDVEHIAKEAAALREEVARLRGVEAGQTWHTNELQRHVERETALQSRLAAAVRALEAAQRVDDFYEAGVGIGASEDACVEWGQQFERMEEDAKRLRTAALAADADGEGHDG